jgi:voltage-gated potassium channel
VDEGFRPRRIVFALVILLAFLIGGAIGFHQTLDETWLQALYRAVVTISLAGLDTVPRNDSSRVVSIVLVVAGVTIFALVATTIVEGISRGVFTGALAEKRRRRAIDRMRDHYIICGYGRVGQRIAEEFRHTGAPYVVLDFHEYALEAAREHGDDYVDGNATNDDDLREAGIERAKGVVAASDSDADNLYVALSARSVNPDSFIVARASNSDAAKKLRLAGADRVVEPYSAAGRTMANLMLKPQVTAFIDVVTTAASDSDLSFEELLVPADFAQAGQTIGELRIRGQTGAVVIAVRKRDGHFETTPNPDMTLEPGDVIIAAGTDEELGLLENLFRSAGAVAGR